MNGLVLSGGGARAVYQVGVLSYLVEKVPELTFPIVAGVSAGAINAAFVASHRGSSSESLDVLTECWNSLSIDQVFDPDIAVLGVSGARWLWTLSGAGASLGPKVKGFLDTKPLREFLRARLDVTGIAGNVKDRRLRALGLSATRYATGQTVTFVEGQADIATWERTRRCGVATRITLDHVLASGALPLIFPAISIEGEYYGDGSIRQAAPLAPAIHLGADRLLAVATRYSPTLNEVRGLATAGYPPPAQIMGILLNSIFLDTLDVDAERLQRVNRLLEGIPPSSPVPEGLRPINLLVIRPSRDLGSMAEGFGRLLPRSLRFMMRGLGIQRHRSADLLSYLIFEQPYLSLVMELGYEDALSNWGRIERFFTEAN